MVLGVVLALVLLIVWVINSLLTGLADFSAGFEDSEVTVTRVDLSPRVTLAGTIAPTQRLDLSFTSEGEVVGVPVTVGDRVTRGTELASIDDAELRAAVSDASAEATAAREDYNAARRTGPAAAVTAARSGLALKDQALREARAELERATLTSTIEGVVAAVNVKVGDRVGSTAAAPAAGGGEAGASVVVISHTFQVDANVGSADRARVARGMKATVLASSTRTPLTGTVTSVGVIAASADAERPSAATFPVTVTIDGEPEDVFTGGAATVELVGEGRTGVLAIPRDAVMEWRDSEGTVLARRGGGEPDMVTVTLGASEDDLVEVVSGLDEGDVVIVPMQVPGMTGGAEVTVEGSGPAEAEPPR